ncbi:hypothetical protein, partial [uncultured Limosilactobacillus sp.]|uniref:hypothetical protein n=1 Tax=uncultured Limosilactobacillus sp. TaxID=2837629 RepID=UPI00259ADD31
MGEASADSATPTTTQAETPQSVPASRPSTQESATVLQTQGAASAAASQATPNIQSAVVSAAPAQVAQKFSERKAAVTTSPVPTARKSLNDQIGTADGQIAVTSHEVTQSVGNKLSGTPGTLDLHLGLNIPVSAMSNIQSGDYLDVKLGLPYQTSDGQNYILNYGSINGQAGAQPINYRGNVVGYIVPVGDLLNKYRQTVVGPDGQETVQVNNNTDQASYGSGNGYYRIIFTDGLRNILASHPGISTPWDLSADLVWYNGSSNGDDKVKKPTDRVTVYTNGDASSYQPDNDLQVGNLSMASGVTVKAVKVNPQHDAISLSNETVASNHTASTPAHNWFKDEDGKDYVVTSPQQGVGLSLPTTDGNNHQLGNDFTITVTKPSGTKAVTMNFVSADALQQQLQKLIVPASYNSAMADRVDDGDYYLSHLFTYQAPKVTVTSTGSGDQVAYHVQIDGDYQGFRSNNEYQDNQGDHRNSLFTLINWTPNDSQALLPPANVKTPDEDAKGVTYQGAGNWIAGYPIKSTDIKDDLKDKPWHVTVSNNTGFNYDTDYGYWIDRGTSDKPISKGQVDNHYYGWVKQTIHYVNEQGQPMKDANGQPITDMVRNVQFESTEDDNTFADQKSFANDIDVPSITGYTAYAGLKDGDQLKIVDGKAQTTGGPIAKYGKEPSFGFPHADFVEYVVYKKRDQAGYSIYYRDVTDDPTNLTPTSGTDLGHAIPNITGYVGDTPDRTEQLWNYQDQYVLVGLSPNAKNDQLAKQTLTKGVADQYVYLVRKAKVQHETKKATRTIHYVANDIHGENLQGDVTQQVTLTGTYYVDATAPNKRVNAEELKINGVVQKDADGNLIYVVTSGNAKETWTIKNDPNNHDVTTNTSDNQKFDFAKAEGNEAPTNITVSEDWSHNHNNVAMGNWVYVDSSHNKDYSFSPNETTKQTITLDSIYLIYKQQVNQVTETKKVSREIHYYENEAGGHELTTPVTQQATVTGTYYVDTNGNRVNAVPLMDAQGNVQKDSQGKDIYVITDGTAPEKWTTGGHSKDVTEDNQKYHFDKATLENGEYYDSFNDPTYRTDAKYDWYYVNDNNGTNKEAMFDPVKGENVTWDVDKKNGKLPNIDLIYKQKGQYNIHYIDVTGSTKTTEYTPDDGILLPDADWEIANIGQGKFAGDSTDASSDIADRQDKFKDKYVEVQEDPNLGKLTIEPNMKDQYVYLVRKAKVQHETKKATRTIHYV